MAEISRFDIRKWKENFYSSLYLYSPAGSFKPNISSLGRKKSDSMNSLGKSTCCYLAEARLIDLQYPAGI